MFKFKLGQKVKATISGETGFVKGQAEYEDSHNMVLIHYKDATGRALDGWFKESELDSDF